MDKDGGRALPREEGIEPRKDGRLPDEGLHRGGRRGSSAITTSRTAAASVALAEALDDAIDAPPVARIEAHRGGGRVDASLTFFYLR